MNARIETNGPSPFLPRQVRNAVKIIRFLFRIVDISDLWLPHTAEHSVYSLFSYKSVSSRRAAGIFGVHKRDASAYISQAARAR